LIETITIRKIERGTHQESGEHESQVSCGHDWHEVRWVRHILFDFENLRISFKQEHAEADEACKLAVCLKVLWFDVQYSINMIGKLRSGLQMKGHRDESIDVDQRDCHRHKANDADHFVPFDFSLEHNRHRHYVVSYSNEMVVFTAGLFSYRLAHNLFTFVAEINVETEQNVGENDDSDGLLEG
jgi:hypothetical protein